METFLKGLLKVAAVALTAPATFEVAGTLYTDYPWWLRLIVQVAALALIEGALLLGWYMLDKQKTAELRWLYAALAAVAYGALWILALIHGEGAAGIIFRSTIGVLLLYSIVASGVLDSVRMRAAVNRDIGKHRKVHRAQQQADIDIKLAEISSSRQLRLEALALQTGRSQQRLKLEDRAESQRLRDGDRETSETPQNQSRSSGGGLATPEQAREGKSRKKARRLELGHAIVQSNPQIGGDEFLKQYLTAIRREFGSKEKISESQGFADLSEIRKEMGIAVKPVNGQLRP